MKCLYAPNRDSVEDINNNESSVFFKEVFRDDEDTEYEHIIMTGNFNVAPVHTNDTSRYLHINNANTRRLQKS